MSDVQNIAPVVRGRPFQKGHAATKPKGTRSRANQLMDKLFGKNPDDLQKIVDVTIAAARRAEPWAVEAILKRLWIPAKDRVVTFPMKSIRTQADVVEALSSLMMATGQGKLTPGEASALASVLEKIGKALEAGEVEKRLVALERLAAVPHR